MRSSAGRVAFAGVVAALVLAVSIAIGPAAAQATDPLVGTWTLNVAKSTFSPGPGLKSGSVTFHAVPAGMHVMAEMMDAQGAAQKTEYTANYDGKDYPITGVAGVDTVSLKKIDATTGERTDKKGGKVVGTWQRKVSADGKTLTVTQKGTDAQGRAVNNVLVFDRKM
jgi:hypothetical protein